MEDEAYELYFTVVGHPNEGKSSLVSTLIEDDGIRVSPWPGETRKSEEHALQPGHEARVFFMDTPGFQSPRRTLEWVADHEKQYGGKDLVRVFLKAHEKDPDFKDECEIFETILKSDGILYVVDATRPIRKGDVAEMETLRLLGLPRMAVMNPKDAEEPIPEDWKLVLRKNFNAVHVFNALSAGFPERVRLLSSLQSMDPDLGGLLQPLVTELEQNWEKRLSVSARLILDLVEQVSAFKVSGKANTREKAEELPQKLAREWQEGMRNLEKKSWNTMRELFRHRVFAPVPGLLKLEATDLFSKESFKIFGLSRPQLAAVGGGTAAAVGLGVDLALGGASLGLVGLASGAIGAGWTYWGTRNVDAGRIAGIRISGVDVTAGPVRDVRIPWMVLDRSLALFHAFITRPHAVRDSKHPENKSFLQYLEKEEQRKIISLIFRASAGNLQDDLREEVSRILLKALHRISGQKK